MPRGGYIFFFSSRRRHTRCSRDWSSDVCSSNLVFPRLSASLRIKRAQAVVHRPRREPQPARRRHWSTERDRSRVHPRNKTAERHVPNFFSLEEIHGRYSPPGRRIAGKSARRQQRGAKHGEGCARLPREFTVQPVEIARVLSRFRKFVLRDKLNENRQTVRVHEQQVPLRVVR